MSKRVGGFIGQDGLNAPDEPTNVAGASGDSSAEVSFDAPADVGGAAVTGYRVTDSTGAFGASGTSSPITVTGLTNGNSYTFRVWAINPFGYSAPSDASGSVVPAVPPIGIIGAGNGSNVIQYVNISTTGVTTDWGDMTDTSREKGAGAGSSSRGLLSTGTITYITYASQGNAQNFGNLSVGRYNFGAFSNSTRAVFGGGFDNGTKNVMDYVTIASTGNATDFGDITATGLNGMAGCGSPTRGLITGGYDNEFPAVRQNTISYVTIASTGNTSNFGDMTVGRDLHGAASNSTRAIFAQAYNSNVMDYVTIASTGNAVDFGDLVAGVDSYGTWGLSSSTRAIFGGESSCDYVEIATTGNSVDFVSLTSSGDGRRAATSNVHGGLS